MKSVLIIGMGRFGRHMAQKLYDLGHDVLAIDKNEEKINKVLSYVTNAQIGDSTDESFIDSLGVSNFDLCVVAIGDDFQSSLETTALLKDYGSKLVVARAVRDVHAKFLLRNGADEVVYLTPEYSIYEIAAPTAWIGKTMLELDIRRKYHINILATKINGILDPLPSAEHTFQESENILILAQNSDVQKFLRF